MDDGTPLGWMRHPQADVPTLPVDVPPPHADLIKLLINTTPLRSEVGPLVWMLTPLQTPETLVQTQDLSTLL